MFRNLSSQKFEFVDTLKNIITPNSILLEQNLDLFLQFQQNISLYLGEVLLWDLSQEDDLLLATSGIGDDAHREPVVRVLWITDTTKKTQLNVSRV